MDSDNTQKSNPLWHIASVSEAIGQLGSNIETGLSHSESSLRLEKHGENAIQSAQAKSIWRILLAQFTDFMILVLIAAAVVSGVIGEVEDTIAILVILVLNAVIGTVQEYRADRALAMLQKLTTPNIQVLREGMIELVSSQSLVPGDIIFVEAGNVVPADIRLADAAKLQIDESLLTGESVAADKLDIQLANTETPLADRKNMAYKGSHVTRGRSKGIVVATGMDTEIGRIAQLLAGEELGATPLQQRLNRLGKRLTIMVLMVAAIVLLAGVLRGEAFTLMFLTAVSMAVAGIPEALPAVVTISLALGAKGMGSRNVLVRRLPAVETLGSVTFICSDKTGTLTQNRMNVEGIWLPPSENAEGDWHERLPHRSGEPGRAWWCIQNALALSNDVGTDAKGEVLGDPTEIALYQAALSQGFNKQTLKQQLPRVTEIAFESERKCMTTVHRNGDATISFSKGAPENILSRCHDTLGPSGIMELDSMLILEKAESLAAKGYRVLALACRQFQQPHTDVPLTSVEDDLSFLGLVALIDPPRQAAKQAVADCITAGITPVMITGDHPATARHIAARLGIIKDDSQRVISGQELAKIADEELEKVVFQTRVYARVSPEQKIRLVKAIQNQGEFVAMTGDGVNDAPALKSADIGVAMGARGTDVARESSDMVLTDDNFASIVAAVKEGRRIFDNIRKFVRYTMSSNAGEIIVLIMAPIFGMPLPLTPLQILWINLVTDGLPGLALSTEKAERGIMQRPPRRPDEPIFSSGMIRNILWVGALIGGLSLATQAWALNRGLEHWQTMVFTVLTFSQLANVLAIRSEQESLVSLGIFSNLPLIGAILVTVLLQLGVIYLPFMNDIFGTQALTGEELLICMALPLIVLVAIEVNKLISRK